MPSTPRNLGNIIIADGDLEAARFWLRVFQLEPYVAAAQAAIQARPETVKASIPIINEYVAGQLYWYYAIVLFIDSLGLSGAIGVIFYADEGHRKAAEEKRNDLADSIMQGISERVEEGKMEGTILTVDPGKE